MFYVSLCGPSKGTLRCYTSICDGIINFLFTLHWDKLTWVTRLPALFSGFCSVLFPWLMFRAQVAIWSKLKLTNMPGNNIHCRAITYIPPYFPANIEILRLPLSAHEAPMIRSPCCRKSLISLVQHTLARSQHLNPVFKKSTTEKCKKMQRPTEIEIHLEKPSWFFFLGKILSKGERKISPSLKFLYQKNIMCTKLGWNYGRFL